ncbi:ABC transporter ATP-binding protein [Pedobacter gandavensis]|uniref:ATP-binding cassette domain-containing protein n=1 Tax=Pedobacter gandavensis TaxID=2679963 RepID=A0ABR6ET09_9SPHI|nr:ABC transporter ATP-binding protein [Pedobacter gandavensis]MBB2148400.1 ATP-binding cassette domain-containing protein [Pedobacter gandavensis]
MIKSFLNKLHKLSTNLNLLRILKLIWSASKVWTTVSIAFIIVESVLFFSSLYMLKKLIDTVSKYGINNLQNESEVIKYLSLAALSAISYAAIKAISSYITEKQSGEVAEYIDSKIHESAIGLDLSFYESPEYFDILKRARDMGSDRPNLIVFSIVDIAKNTMSLIVIASMLVAIDWRLFPILALFVIPTLWVRINFADSQNALRIAQTALERKSNYLSTLLTADTHAKEIRSFGLGDYLRKIHVAIRLDLLSGRLKISKRRTYKELLTSTIAAIGFFACIAYIAIGSIHGRTSVGDITLFLVAFPQAFNILQGLSSSISTLYQNNIFVKSVFELFDLKSSLPEAEHPIPIPDDSLIDLEIKDLNFTYPHAKRPTLTNINIKMPAGKIVAVVGMNGAGKSTLIKLMCRLYDPSSGQIMLNGTDIRRFESRAYRKEICAVFQDFGKYNVSAADNIRFGDIDGIRSEEELQEAAKNSGADSFIDTFPAGYQTIMGRIFEDGHEVSIGQWQKLAIARAFYSKSRFIILDEATSALDANAEKILFDSFRERIGNRAAIIISHRQSAVKHADYIYMLSNGKIVEAGTNEALMALQGHYFKLFNKDSLHHNS